MGADFEESNNTIFTGEKHLITIAINDYENPPFKRLKYPVSDAERFIELLKSQYGFKDENCKSFHNEECEKDMIIDGINAVTENIKYDDQLVVFFAGHGAVKDSAGFWIPYDSKERIKSNLSVLAIIELLENVCKQVLLIVDCCCAGIATEKAFTRPLFSKAMDNPRFSVIASGNKYESVPDKSIFMEVLMEQLSTKNISNFEELVGGIRVEMTLRKQQITSTPGNDQEEQSFVLERKDKVVFELTNSFYSLNYTPQLAGIQGSLLFNLFYLRGTADCGHHLFTQRYFKENGKSKVSMFDYMPTIVKFGGVENTADYNIWSKIGKEIGLNDAAPATIIEKIFKEREAKNWLCFVKVDGSCVTADLQKTLFDFWEKINEYIASPGFKLGYDKKNTNSIYLFIWDMRGDMQEEIENLWKNPTDVTLAKFFHPPAIKPLSPEIDLLNWKSKLLGTNFILQKEDTFNELDVLKIQQPYNISNVIRQISKACNREVIHDTLFITKNFWIQ